MRIEQGARIIVENWIHAQPEDVIHFITDETKLREAEAFTYATHQIGAIFQISVLILLLFHMFSIYFLLHLHN